MIIWLVAAQHQLLARPTWGEKRRLSTRSWHASRRGAAVVAARTVIPMSTHLVQGGMRASLIEKRETVKSLTLLTAEHRDRAHHRPNQTRALPHTRRPPELRKGLIRRFVQKQLVVRSEVDSRHLLVCHCVVSLG